MHISPGIMIKILISVMMAASLLDMYALQQLKEYSPRYNSEGFIRRNLRWLRPASLFRYILGRNTIQFLQRRTLLFPLFEIAFGLCTLVALLLHDLTREFARSLIYFVVALPISLIAWQDDDSSQAVTPDSLTIPGMLLGVFTSVLFGAQNYSGKFSLFLANVASHPKFLMAVNGLLSSIAGMLVSGGFIWLTGWIYLRLRHVEGMGQGAIKAAMVVGAFTGVKGGILDILLASIVGSIVGFVGMALGRISYRDTPMPFSSFIAMAGLVSVIAGPAVVDWRIKLYK
jgi:prepilin signal peptidase PulO-like enzyme (type II secretory pathway)